VLLPAEERSQARTRLAQEDVRDGIYTEHWGDKQLRDLHTDLPEVLRHLIEERGMEAMVDPTRTSVRFNIFVAPTQCEVGLRVRGTHNANPENRANPTIKNSKKITWAKADKNLEYKNTSSKTHCPRFGPGTLSNSCHLRLFQGFSISGSLPRKLSVISAGTTAPFFRFSNSQINGVSTEPQNQNPENRAKAMLKKSQKNT
jgi:hypothetical protein